MPNLAEVGDAVEQRFQQIGQMLDGTPPTHAPEALDIATDKQAVRGLQHFETAALAVTRTQMLRIESLTRNLFETVADIQGFGSPGTRPAAKQAQPGWSVPDPDRNAAAVRTMVTLWLAYLLWIYTEVPGGIGVVVMCGSLGMAASSMPQFQSRCCSCRPQSASPLPASYTCWPGGRASVPPPIPSPVPPPLCASG